MGLFLKDEKGLFRPYELRTATLDGEWVSQLFGIDDHTYREPSALLCA